MYSSFNPHTHAGCDCIYNCACGYGYVSIHTPTQGVTELVKRIPSVKQFQSTHPRRVWLVHLVLEIPPYMFQSTHPRRVWPSARSFLIFIPGFNPHTHAGCDSCILSYWTNNWCFNPHTHAGCDLNLLLWMICLMFQSTHPRRVWHRARGLSSLWDSFQSTHPRRVWPMAQARAAMINAVSIHTPTQGVTLLAMTIVLRLLVSIHTPTQGVTILAVGLM